MRTADHDNGKTSFLLIEDMYTQFHNRLSTDHQLFWDRSLCHIFDTRNTNNRNESWQEDIYGNRYGNHVSSTGLLSEFIALASVHSTDAPCYICSKKEQQATQKIDFLTDNASYQVKTMLLGFDMPCLDNNITKPDYMIYVDIDYNKISVVSLLNLRTAIKDHPDTRRKGSGVDAGLRFNPEILELSLIHI